MFMWDLSISLVLKRVWYLYVSGGKFFWDTGKCGHWGFHVKCVSKNRDGLGGNTDKVHMSVGSMVLVLGMGHKVRRGHIVWYRAADKTWGLVWRRGGRVKIWSLSTYFTGLLSSFPAWLADSLRKFAEVKSWDKIMSGVDGWKRLFSWFHTDGERVMEVSVLGGLLQRCGWDWGTTFWGEEGVVNICS